MLCTSLLTVAGARLWRFSWWWWCWCAADVDDDECASAAAAADGIQEEDNRNEAEERGTGTAAYAREGRRAGRRWAALRLSWAGMLSRSRLMSSSERVVGVGQVEKGRVVEQCRAIELLAGAIDGIREVEMGVGTGCERLEAVL